MPNHSVVDPSSEEVLATLELAPADEVDRVVAVAEQAFPSETKAVYTSVQ
jgi:acyl-CoA reductase-like NAD-dependent aldehyde dehydrogenase